MKKALHTSLTPKKRARPVRKAGKLLMAAGVLINRPAVVKEAQATINPKAVKLLMGAEALDNQLVAIKKVIATKAIKAKKMANNSC